MILFRGMSPQDIYDLPLKHWWAMALSVDQVRKERSRDRTATPRHTPTSSARRRRAR